MFIDILLYNVSSQENRSLNQLTVESLSEHGVSISKQGLDKRFNERSVSFVKALLERTLQNQAETLRLNQSWLDIFERIRIKDGTRFEIPEQFQSRFPGSGGSASKAGVCI